MRSLQERPSYLATKSDYYTHVMDIPPQYGAAYATQAAAVYNLKVKVRSLKSKV